MDPDERLRTMELSSVRVEERLVRVEHDSKNTRSMVSSLGTKLDTKFAQIEQDIKTLSRTLFNIGLALVGSIITLLIAVVAYFLAERSEMVKQTYTKVEQQGPRR